MLSLPPRTDENSLITIAQLKNQVKSLEERIEAVETQMVPFEKGNYAIKGFVSLAMREGIVNGKMSQSNKKLTNISIVSNIKEISYQKIK